MTPRRARYALSWLIFFVRSASPGFDFRATSPKAPTIRPKVKPPTSMPKTAVAFSYTVAGVISPYPTVVIVMNAQYSDVTYRS